MYNYLIEKGGIVDIVDVLIKVGLYLLGVATLFIVPKWASAVITYATKHKYDEMIESIKLSYATALDREKNDRELRLKSALIAELLAEWLSRPDDRTNLRKLTYEAFLWLPAPLAEELSKILSHKDNAKDPKAFLLDVRQLLLGKDDSLREESVIHFPHSQYEQQRQRENHPFDGIY